MPSHPLRVLIVDDSRIFRSVIEEVLAGIPDVQIVGSVWSGEKALELSRSELPDLVTLDIEMPGIGGIETLKRLRELGASQRRAIGVLLVSSHTRRGTTITIEGLQEGAFDFITKPDSADLQANSAMLREQLRAKLEAFRSRRGQLPAAQRVPSRPVWIRKRSTRFRAVVIGSSTGGPEALNRVLPILVPASPVPIFLVQHFPEGFTSIFAADLARRCSVRSVEPQGNVVADPGTVYVAPSGKHLVLNDANGKVALGFSDSPAENGFRPSADVLFRSAAVACSGHVLTVVLTGMGSDGTKGAAVLRRAGAHIIVQDEATSVVWGMPGSVVNAGLADEVLPIDQIAARLLNHLGLED